jgi:hypothetical protein
MCDAPGFVAGEQSWLPCSKPHDMVVRGGLHNSRSTDERMERPTYRPPCKRSRTHEENARTPQRNEETVSGREKFAAHAQRRKIVL